MITRWCNNDSGRNGTGSDRVQWALDALQSGGQNQKWPTSGQGRYITPAAWGVPATSERGAESEVAAVRNGKSYFLGATQQGVDFRVGGQYQQ